MKNRLHLGRCLALAALLGLAGCYKATFYQNPRAIPGERHERWTAFFIFGLVGSERIDVRDFCGPDEVAAVRSGGNFATGLLSAITIGIYTPRKVYVTCAAQGVQARSSDKQLELALDADGRPVAAQLRTSRGVSAARVEQLGPQAFRIQQASGAQGASL